MLRSVLAVAAGFLAATLLGWVGQQMFAAVLPEQAMPGTSLVPVASVMVLLFEGMCNVGGGFVAGRLAPAKPQVHAVMLGAVLALLELSGSVAQMAPGWYWVAVVLVTVPAAGLGGRLAERHRGVAAETV